ncbi:aspartyl-tRNA synthetase [endosymbiont of Sipalinus gigas]|uniref:aspartate--tRNA ligase n=1 Tax=endosymbiont of Sipalinus gigas TaxID=1972134 RepID=UPI000DC70E10|nr:aspartate--tRNA ligase [endosymbiont of Sipalinus gigas]BBA85204.1 aspartyl-tRNA synthetase [endosymbiont of Sipalinus gigas]
MNYFRKCDCNSLNKYINKYIYIYGWIDDKRYINNNCYFIEIRDFYGKIQINFNKKNINNNSIFYILKKIKNESCVKIYGFLKNRPIDKINYEKLNGDLEIIATNILVINYSDEIPININNFSEKNKLKFRYLYLRKNLNLIKIRSYITYEIHKFMNKNKFINIETPILSKYLPEGARNYIVNSRIYENKYYSLSQSPQIFKQILMMSGVNKYYQIARCFRNEDLRSDRQPEFTQLDIEVSFLKSNYIIYISEKLIKFLFKKINNINIEKIKKIKFKDSIIKYGTDKPDLRNFIELFYINEIFRINKDINKFINKKIFNKKNKIISFFNLPNININYYKILENFNFKNINFFITNKNKISKFLNKIFNNLFKLNLLKINNNTKYDIFIILIGDKDEIYKNLLNIRNSLFKEIKMYINNVKTSLIWITNFPMFKEVNNKIECNHHPFTLPKTINNIYNINNKKKILSILSNSYDLVLNGFEIASGSERINNKNIQNTIFDIINVNKNNEFNFFLEALKYGTPNHSGIAFGLDRLIMLLNNLDNIKEIIPFPKTSSFKDIMTDSPNKIF